MYMISNSNLKEAIHLLQYVDQAPGNDIKTLNAKRRSRILIKQLKKATKI